MTNLSKRTLKVLLFVVIAVVVWAIWNVTVTQMFTSGDQTLGVVAFWLGRWTFTGWIFYLAVVCMIYWVLAKQLERRLNRNTGVGS